MSLQVSIQRAKPIWLESGLAVGIGIAIVLSMVATDISFHDNYVGLIIEICHPDNQSAECTEIRESLGVGITDQLEIGNPYWERLFNQALEIFLILFLVRLGFAYYLKVMKIRGIRPTTILMAIIWGASASVIFTFGMIDTLYFVVQGIEIPDTLDWLNGGLVFLETKEFFGDPTIVEKEDLFATNIIGFLIVFSLIVLNVFIFNHNGYKSRAIA